MLQTIHDKLKGWLAMVVLGAIGLVFVFWGINWTLSAPNYAAKVNGSEVSANEVRQSYQQQLAQVERQFNGSVSEAQRNDIKKRVLDQYVNSEALITRAQAVKHWLEVAQSCDCTSVDVCGLFVDPTLMPPAGDRATTA